MCVVNKTDPLPSKHKAQKLPGNLCQTRKRKKKKKR